MMSKRRKYSLVGILLALFLALFCTVYYTWFWSEPPDIPKTTLSKDYTVSLRYVNSEGTFELRSLEGYGTYLTKDGEEVEFISTIPRESNPLLSLPESTASDDITKTKEPSQPYSWDVSLEESASYLNYLTAQGYRPLTEATTVQFIEKYLSNGKSTIRVLVLKTVLITGEVDEGVVLPSLEDYLN